ncbi:MAG: hypothetical protein MJ068_01655 [Clostridia bacterium]|nr:hypothetical protein [Clostridia bacterium]
MWFGDGSQQSLDIIHEAMTHVRDVNHFNWTFIFILCCVATIYTYVIVKKDWKTLIAGISLYSVHWFYEICNALIAAYSPLHAPLWTVTVESTSFMLMIGVCWELSMMFSVAGMLSYKVIQGTLEKNRLTYENYKGTWVKLIGAIIFALGFSFCEVFLATTNAFQWYYPWWGFLMVFITTYVPFFLASNFVPDANPKFQKIFLITLITVNIVLYGVFGSLRII